MIHQFWHGEMPENIALWTGKIRKLSGGTHRLWTWEDFFEENPRPTADLIEKAREKLPREKWASLASDFLRMYLIAKQGGLYLDADTVFSGQRWDDVEDAVRDLPQGIYGSRERYNPNLPNSCLLWAKGEKGQSIADAALKAAETRLASILIDEQQIADIADGKMSLCDVLGPRWLRRTIGKAFRPLPVAIASSHNPSSLLYHKGLGTWMTHPKGENRPEWLQPCGQSILPNRHTSCTSRAGQRHSPGTSTAQPVQNTFGLPLGTIRKASRIVILSNITQGFNPSDVPILPGDLVCHCNRAVHYPTAKTIPNTTHWLFVRSGKAENGRKWYTPSDFDGFHRVRFIDDGSQVHSQKWYTDYKLQGGTSPTTGFIVANTMRELSPDTPLILAGFDPAVPHGTPLWHGHNWQLEKQWYATQKFKIIAPQLLKF